MSVFVQPSLGHLSVLSSAYPAPPSPLPLLDQGALDQHGFPCGCGVPCSENQLAVAHDSGGAITPVAGPRGNVERFTLSPEALPVTGYNLGSVESHGLLDASELDRVRYVVEMLRSENVATREVLDQVVASTRSELLSMNGRFGNGLGQLRNLIGDVNHQDFNAMKREIDRLCDQSGAVLSKLAETDRPTQAIHVRCDGIELDTARKSEEYRADYVQRLRGLAESFASRTVELENFVQSQLAGYREQFMSIDRRFGKIEAKLAGIGVAPSLVGSAASPSQPVIFRPPSVSQTSFNKLFLRLFPCPTVRVSEAT